VALGSTALPGLASCSTFALGCFVVQTYGASFITSAAPARLDHGHSPGAAGAAGQPDGNPTRPGSAAPETQICALQTTNAKGRAATQNGGSCSPWGLRPVTVEVFVLAEGNGPGRLAAVVAGGQADMRADAGYRAAPAMNAATIYVACPQVTPQIRAPGTPKYAEPRTRRPKD
jgi:hypothetical protein